MNGAFPPPSDEELQSFLDGEIEPARRGAIETFLRGSPAYADRVETWRRQRDVIRAAFAPVEAEPLPPSILLPPPPGQRALLRLFRPRAGAGGASGAATQARAGATPLIGFALFAAGALTALGGAFYLDRLHAPPVAAEIRTPAPASADEIMADRTLAALMELKPQDHATGLGAAPRKPARAPKAASLIVPNLTSAGFTLVGMRAAPARSGEADDDMFCLFYAKAAEPPIALCIAPDRDGGAQGRFRLAGKSPANGPGPAISWRQANAIYALAGPMSELQLRALANRVSAEIEAFD